MPKSNPATYQVSITQGAEADIMSTIDFLLPQGDDDFAGQLLQEFSNAFKSLEQFLSRGHFPPELAELPDKAIRELHVNVYRLIYRIVEQNVFILFVADGRRNIQQALVNRAMRLSA